MTIDDFFKECEGKGAIPLSYKSHKKFANGSRTVEYENPDYKKAREKLAKILGFDSGDESLDAFLAGLHGEEVVIRTRDGYHHGILNGYDGKSFMLDNYLFSKKPLDIFKYSTDSLLNEDGAVPAEGIISFSKMPLMTEYQFR